MNQSPKLSLYLSLGCKPMRDVILKCNNRMSVKDYTIQDIDVMFKGVKCVYIEAIPESLIIIDAHKNMRHLTSGEHIKRAIQYNPIRGAQLL